MILVADQLFSLSMETLKFLFLASLCWQTFRVARGQTAGNCIDVVNMTPAYCMNPSFIASCSVTVGGNAASVTLNSSSDGTFECSLDGGSFEQCKVIVNVWAFSNTLAVCIVLIVIVHT